MRACATILLSALFVGGGVSASRYGRVLAVSPGVLAGVTVHDLQGSGTQGRRVAFRPGADRVHVVYTDLYDSPFEGEPGFYINQANSWRPSEGRFVHSIDVCAFAGGGWQFPNDAGFAVIDIDDSSRVHSVGNEREMGFQFFYTWPHSTTTAFPDLCQLFWDSRAPKGQFSEPIFPNLDIDRNVNGSTDIRHVAGCDTTTSANGIYYYVYWRFDGTSWSNPVLMDSGYTVSQLTMADPTTDEAAYIFCRPLDYSSPSQIDNDIAFYKSSDNGLSWVTSGTGGPTVLTNVTNYAATQNGRAYTDLSAMYDFNGALHIVWNERRFIPPDSHFVGECELVHWDDALATKRPIARAFWDNPAANGQYSMNLCKMTIGVANGWTTCGGQANNNYLYVTYTRFGGPTEAELADHSAAGYMNSELYLSISADAGHTWSPPRNLTNTRTPGCNPATGDSCASEHWATIAKTVDDTIHISYILDRDAGAAPLGEGSWTYNPVMYYRIPGGTDGALCPEIAPVFEYLLTDTSLAASQKSATTTVAKNLVIDDYGNATLSGNISVVYTNPPNPPANWLTVGGSQSQSYAIPAGTPGLRWLAAASNTGLEWGKTYQGELRITHNDPHKPSPQVLPFEITAPACSCLSQGDVNPDGVPDVFDIVGLIDYVFSGAAQPPKDPACPHVDRGDVNCSGYDDVLDVVWLIDYAFSGGTLPCNPCTCNPYPTNCP